MRPIDNYFFQQEEPVKSCLQFLRAYILKFDAMMHERWQYGMPFYYHGNKRVCYLWTHKKSAQPYLGIVDGASIDQPYLIQEKRARMKIMLIDPLQDIPLERIDFILSSITAT